METEDKPVTGCNQAAQCPEAQGERFKGVGKRTWGEGSSEETAECASKRLSFLSNVSGERPLK